jgi:single-stranded-DNA-specific exonuclease
MLDAIAFNVDLAIWPDATIKHARVVYKLDVNEFRGNQTVQLMVDYIEPL